MANPIRPVGEGTKPVVLVDGQPDPETTTATAQSHLHEVLGLQIADFAGALVQAAHQVSVFEAAGLGDLFAQGNVLVSDDPDVAGRAAYRSFAELNEDSLVRNNFPGLGQSAGITGRSLPGNGGSGPRSHREHVFPPESASDPSLLWGRP